MALMCKNPECMAKKGICKHELSLVALGGFLVLAAILYGLL